jgi:hypothetical protein
MFRRYAIVDRSDLLAALQQEAALKQQLAETRKAEAELSGKATVTLQLPQA